MWNCMHTMPKDIYLLIWTKLEAVGPFSFGMNIWLNILFVELFDSISNASWSVRLDLPALFFLVCTCSFIISYSRILRLDFSLCLADTFLPWYTRTQPNKKKCCCSIMFVYASMLVQKPILYAFIYSTYTQAYCILFGFVSWLLVCTEPLFYDHQQPLSVFTFSIYF